MNKRATQIPLGNTIIVHRRFRPSIFPANEAGPAAVIFRSVTTWVDVAMLAVRLQAGTEPWGSPLNEEWDWAGCRASREHSVQVVSAWSPPAYLLDGKRFSRLQWQTWSDFQLDAETDVVLCWQPRKLFPKMSLPLVAAHLVEVWFGGGGVYEGGELTSLMRHVC